MATGLTCDRWPRDSFLSFMVSMTTVDQTATDLVVFFFRERTDKSGEVGEKRREKQG